MYAARQLPTQHVAHHSGSISLGGLSYSRAYKGVVVLTFVPRVILEAVSWGARGLFLVPGVHTYQDSGFFSLRWFGFVVAFKR